MTRSAPGKSRLFLPAVLLAAAVLGVYFERGGHRHALEVVFAWLVLAPAVTWGISLRLPAAVRSGAAILLVAATGLLARAPLPAFAFLVFGALGFLVARSLPARRCLLVLMLMLGLAWLLLPVPAGQSAAARESFLFARMYPVTGTGIGGYSGQVAENIVYLHDHGYGDQLQGSADLPLGLWLSFGLPGLAIWWEGVRRLWTADRMDLMWVGGAGLLAMGMLVPLFNVVAAPFAFWWCVLGREAHD